MEENDFNAPDKTSDKFQGDEHISQGSNQNVAEGPKDIEL